MGSLGLPGSTVKRVGAGLKVPGRPAWGTLHWTHPHLLQKGRRETPAGGSGEEAACMQGTQQCSPVGAWSSARTRHPGSDLGRSMESTARSALRGAGGPLLSSKPDTQVTSILNLQVTASLPNSQVGFSLLLLF